MSIAVVEAMTNTAEAGPLDYPWLAVVLGTAGALVGWAVDHLFHLATRPALDAPPMAGTPPPAR